MTENVKVNWQSSVRIEGKETVVYVDPWKIDGALHDADIICVTHKHFDHMSIEDIEKVSKKGTILIAPVGIRDEISEGLNIEEKKLCFFKPGDISEFGGVKITAVPSYNVGKDFHKKEYGWLGYVIELDGVKYYVAGDTDVNEDILKVRCDVAIVPIGGFYTMNKEEAAEFINRIAPKYCVPTHYGCVENAGEKDDGVGFSKLVNSKTEVVLKLK